MEYKVQCKGCHAECIVISKDDIISAEFNKLGVRCPQAFKKVEPTPSPVQDKRELCPKCYGKGYIGLSQKTDIFCDKCVGTGKV